MVHKSELGAHRPPRRTAEIHAITAPAAPATATDLSLTRLHLVCAGYLLMGVGLALVKWPLLLEADARPLDEGVTLCLLTAMSLLAFLGLRHPVKLLPLLLFARCCPSAGPVIAGDAVRVRLSRSVTAEEDR